MVKSVEGVWRDGKVELLEPAPTVGEARVIVTFLAAEQAAGQALRSATDEENVERLRQSFDRLSRDMGPRQWTREQLHER
jgi:hypothetical protein